MVEIQKGGRSSVVERQLPKLYVEGSIPFARSKYTLNLIRNAPVTPPNDPTIEISANPTAVHYFARTLWLASGLGAVLAGLILWSARGERVFSDLVSATISWCL